VGEKKKRVTLICSRNTLDGMYPPLILALNAVRAGAEAMVFFTFQGLDVVTKKGYQKIKFYPPGLCGVIPGLPALATRMMCRLAEERANVPSPAELMEMCRYEGVKFYACQMTKDMMAVRDEDLLEGVQVIDAGGYMKLALQSDVNMFI